MESRVSYTLAGVFVIALSAVGSGLVIWLVAGGEQPLFDTYQVYLGESVAGLNPRAAVRYRGVDVGKVADIRLDPNDPRQVRLTLNIQQGTPIREDTIAALSTQGLTGLATVELSGGSPQSPPLQSQSDEPYPIIRSGPSLVKRLDDAFSDAMLDFDRLSSNIDRLLNAETIDAFGALLANLRQISDRFAANGAHIETLLANAAALSTSLADDQRGVGAVLRSAAETFENIASASAQLPALISDLGKAAVASREMALTIRRTSSRFDQTLEASRRDLRRLVERSAPEFTATLSELQRLSDSVHRFVNELERNPQMLLLGKPEPAAGPGE